MSDSKGPAGSIVEVDGKDLPVHCPNPKMPVWSSHPRVFLDVVREGEASCPYCGTVYRLRPGAVIKPHH
jgi:uncharacterized Zn-finger protein